MIACPSCARESPAEFAFCPACGTKLALEQPQVRESKALTEERKVVTTVFCDLVSYTAHSEAADHELIDAMLQRYNALAKRLVEGHGGVVEKFIGDAVLAVFGFPRAHDDDAERAVRCALKLAAEAGGLTWPDGDPAEVRIGVNSGETYLHTDVDPASGETFLTGDAVNTAARLETAAPPGGIVVGELTHSLTDKTITYEELEPLVLKGKGEPVPAWLAKGVREDRSRTGLRTTGKLDTPFLGRSSELRSLEAALDAADSTRRVQFRLLVGEPGIGKSRLVLEFARALEARPELITWRQGRCLAFGDGVAFWALGEIVKAHAGILDSDDVVTVEGKLEVVLPEGEQRPWFRQRLRPLLGLEGGQASREESFAAWTQFLMHLAAAGPVVVVLEDLHWAGEGMLAFVDHLASQELDVPLLIVGTARPELLTKHLDALRPADGVGHLILTPLSRRVASRLVSALLDERLAIDVRAPIIERVGGNPLYAEEYVRLLLDRGLLIRTQGALRLKESEKLPLPDTVQAVMAARLDTLPPEHKALLCDAAVFGESFWAGGVAALAECSAIEVEAAMAALAERQLVRSLVSSTLAGEREFAFWHALTRDVAYGQLPRKLRARKHQAAGAWLEERAGTRVADLADVLAHHYSTALDLARSVRQTALAGALLDPAIRYLSLAGDRALSLDVVSAQRHYLRALELGAESPRRPHLLVDWGAATYQRGCYKEAADAFEEAAHDLKAAGEKRAAARALDWLASALGLLGDARSAEPLDEARALLEGDGPSRELMDVLTYVARFAFVLGDEREAIDSADRAMAIARALDLPVPVEALAFRGTARCCLGDLGGLEDSSQAVEFARASGLGREYCLLALDHAATLFGIHGPQAAIGLLREGLDYAQRRGSERFILPYRVSMAEALAFAGEWDEALRLNAQVVKALEDADDPSQHLLFARIAQARLLAWVGEDEVAEPLIAWCLTEAPKAARDDIRGLPLEPASIVELHLGRTEAALALIDEWVRAPRGARPDADTFVTDGVRIALAGGDAGLAERLATSIGAGRADVAERLSPIQEHVLASAEACLAEARGQHEAAAAGFADAAARWHDFGVPYEEAHALTGQGRCLLALGTAAEAEPVIEQAREIFARLGAKPALAEAADLLERGLGPAPG